MDNISLVLPAYNEELVLEDSIERLAEATGEGSEILVVEGGSTDGTYSLCQDLEERIEHVRCIHSDSRTGKGEAIEKGIRASVNDKVCFVDADLPVSVEEVEKVVEHLDEADLVVSSRYLPVSEAERPFHRKSVSLLYNVSVRALFSTGIKDHQCGCKAFRKSAVEDVLDDVRAGHWFWDTEVIVRAQAIGLDVVEIPVEWRNAGESQFNAFTAFPYFLKGMVQMLREGYLWSSSKSER